MLNYFHYVASAQTKKLLKFSLSLFRRGFNPSKCKTAAKMAVARIKLLRIKRQVVVKQMNHNLDLFIYLFIISETIRKRRL
ncbi:hypothetical protein AALP_AA7G232800 [Arabis alpina]|uniref:Uncharacterized protein n=1 Tax=Arabis alpina TaxID=50452 RepID=A0A087GK13_ARAAL|nr:hypothetical protein AALP_AA7G232800 [Arabis alpina]